MAGHFNLFYLSQVPLFTREELLTINDTIENCKSKQPEPKGAGADFADKKSKVSIILWLELKNQLKIIENFIYDANDEFFQYDMFDIDDFDYLNINEYDEKNNSYDWHVDCNCYGAEQDLKLTFLLNISTESYDGGRLHLHGLDKQGQELIFKDFNKPGYALIFTSLRQHKVEPITRGKRKTLSYWTRGPAWK